MATPELILQKLKDRNLRIVAVDADVSYAALTRFAKGKTPNPTSAFIEKLKVYFEQQV